MENTNKEEASTTEVKKEESVETTVTTDESAKGLDPDAAIIALPTRDKGTLSDGREFEVKKGKGRHAMDADRIIMGPPYNGDMSRRVPAVMSLLTLIDGKKYPLEYYEDQLDLLDFYKIQEYFSEKNFSAPN